MLLPLQARLAREFGEGRTIPAEHRRLCRWWNFRGVAAPLLPVAVLYLVVFKNAA